MRGRGGFRGGRGGGRGIGPGGAMEIPAHTDLSKNEWAEALREPVKHSGMLFPPLDGKLLAHMPGPNDFEDQAVDLGNQMIARLSSGREGNSKLSTPWRLVNERKSVGIQIETWAERQAAASHTSNGYGSYGTSGAGAAGKLDVEALYMDPSYFPPALWAEVVEGPAREKSLKRKKAMTAEESEAARKRRLDRMERMKDDDGDDDDKSVAASDSDGQGDFDFDDEEEEDHQDYDANYFDNGEGDDDDEGDDEGGDHPED